METNTLSGIRAGRREWIGLAVLAFPTLLLSIDMSVLYLALPHLAADLQPSSSQLLWTMDVYGFMVAGFLVTMGTLATGSAAGGCCSSGPPRSPSRRWLRPTRRARRC